MNKRIWEVGEEFEPPPSHSPAYFIPHTPTWRRRCSKDASGIAASLAISESSEDAEHGGSCGDPSGGLLFSVTRRHTHTHPITPAGEKREMGGMKDREGEWNRGIWNRGIGKDEERGRIEEEGINRGRGRVDTEGGKRGIGKGEKRKCV